MGLLQKIAGTIESAFQLGIGGPKLKRATAKIQARDAADAAFTNVQGLDAAVDDDLVTLRQLEATEFTLALGHSRLFNHLDGSTAGPITYTLPEDFLNANGSGLKMQVVAYTENGGDLALELGGIGLLEDNRQPTGGVLENVPVQTLVVLDLELTKVEASGGDAHVRWSAKYYDHAGGSAVINGEHVITFTVADEQDIEASWVSGLSDDDIDSFTIDFLGVLPPEAVTENGDTAGTPTPTSAACPTVPVVQHRVILAVNRLGSGTLIGETMGDTGFSAVESFTMNPVLIRSCSWVEFKGKEYCINSTASTGIEVLERDIGGSTWTSVHTITTSAGNWNRTGLYVYNDGSECGIGFVYMESGTALRCCKSTDGSSWTNSGTIYTHDQTVTALHNYGCALLGTSLYVPVRSTSTTQHAVAVDLKAQSATTCGSTALANTNGSGVFAILNNRVFYMSGAATSGNAAQRTLYEIVGGAFTSRLVLGTDGGDTTSVPRAGVLVAIEPLKLLAIYPNNAAAGSATNAYWRATVITFDDAADTTPSEANCDAIIPAGLEVSTGIKFTWHCWVDSETDPSNPQFYFWWVDASAITTSAWQHGQYLGTATQIGGAATGVGPNDYALPTGARGGGDRISPDDDANVIDGGMSIAKNVSAAGRMTLSATMVEQDGTYTAKVWISPPGNGEGVTWVQATLAGTATGGTRVGNTVTGISGAWTVDVDFTAMSIADTTRCLLIVEYYPEV